MVFRVEIPPEGDRTALEDDEEEVKGTEQDTAGNKGVDDVALHLVDGDSEQEETDGDLEQSCTRRVEDLAKVPILAMLASCRRDQLTFTYLQSDLSVCWGDVLNVSSSPVCNTSKLAD